MRLIFPFGRRICYGFYWIYEIRTKITFNEFLYAISIILRIKTQCDDDNTSQKNHVDGQRRDQLKLRDSFSDKLLSDFPRYTETIHLLNSELLHKIQKVFVAMMVAWGLHLRVNCCFKAWIPFKTKMNKQTERNINILFWLSTLLQNCKCLYLCSKECTTVWMVFKH